MLTNFLSQSPTQCYPSPHITGEHFLPMLPLFLSFPSAHMQGSALFCTTSSFHLAIWDSLSYSLLQPAPAEDQGHRSSSSWPPLKASSTCCRSQGVWITRVPKELPSPSFHYSGEMRRQVNTLGRFHRDVWDSNRHKINTLGARINILG